MDMDMKSGYGHAACCITMLHVRVSTLHGKAASPRCMSMLHNYAACQCCTPVLHAKASEIKKVSDVEGLMLSQLSNTKTLTNMTFVAK